MSLISRWKYLFSQHPNLHIIIHRVTVELQVAYLRYLKKVDIGEDCTVHRHAKIDGRNPKGVHMLWIRILAISVLSDTHQ